LIAYAIRQKSTGYFLPSRRSNKKRRGYTHDQPQPWAPRLFDKKQHADCALRMWLEGDWYESSYQNHFGEWDIDVGVRPNSTRNKDDMEVVEVSVSLTGIAAEEKQVTLAERMTSLEERLAKLEPPKSLTEVEWQDPFARYKHLFHKEFSREKHLKQFPNDSLFSDAQIIQRLLYAAMH